MDNLKKHVIELVRKVVTEYASTTIPIFDEICSGLGLDVREGCLPDRIDGTQKGKTIIINSGIKNEERKRFTGFHEVTHHLIEKDGYIISELHEYTTQKDGYTRPLEYLCNIGAAEFLMPSKVFVKLYEEKGFNINLIPVAARYFNSSTIATTIQLAQVAPNSCITAVCESTPNDTGSSQTHFSKVKKYRSTKQKLHVAYSASSPATKYLLAKYTEIPGDHLINQAFLQAQPVEGESYVPFRSGKKMPCYCEALADSYRIYVLFHLTPPPAPNQKSFFSTCST